MTFEIDLGQPERDAAAGWNIGAVGKQDGIMRGVLDALPPDATQPQIDAGMVAAILGDLYGPVLLDTVRGHLLRMWPLIADLADREPDAFDQILTAYAELTTTLPADRSEAIARRKASAEFNSR